MGKGKETPMRMGIMQLLLWCWLSFSCNIQVPEKDEGLMAVDSAQAYGPAGTDTLQMQDSIRKDHTTAADTAFVRPGEYIDVKGVNPEQLVSFAEQQMGVPYRYGSTDPKVGFDCSGFITYVFNHFGISVPRSSIDFTHVGREIPVAQARRGDLILFTGTDSTEQLVGHMGIVVSNTDTLKFIHSTSGKAYGVTITPLNNYYRSRFVKTIRIFDF